MEYIRSLSWLGGLFGVIMVFLVFVGVLFLIAKLVYWGTWYTHRRARPWWKYTRYDEALEILRTRYAKGEITKEQYLEMRKVLEGI